MKYKILIILYSIIFCNSGCTNQAYQFDDEPIIYLYVDKIPKINYDSGLKSFIYSNLRWPKMFDGEGKVIASFIVNKSGKVENIKIEKSLCIECDKEVIRILSLMPDWEPGEYNERIVNVLIYLPIYFRVEK